MCTNIEMAFFCTVSAVDLCQLNLYFTLSCHKGAGLALQDCA